MKRATRESDRQRQQRQRQQQQQQQQHAQHPPTLAAAAEEEDPWELCLTARLLAPFLRTGDLYRLGVCGRKFLDFRKQVWYVGCTRQSMPVVLRHMATGARAEVTTLDLEVSIDNMPKPRFRKTFHNLLVSALNQVPKLEHLKYHSYDHEAFKVVMSQGLTPAAKASLKTLELIHIRSREVDDSTFAGLVSLEKLDCQLVNPALIASLCKHTFSRLHTLSMFIGIGSNDQVDNTEPLAGALVDGKMPNIKSLSLTCIKIGHSFIDALVQLMPRLDRVDLSMADCTAADKKRLRMAAAGSNVRLSL